MNARLASRALRAALILTIVGAAAALWLFVGQSAATLARPTETLALPRSYQITTPATSPSIQFINGSSYAQLSRSKDDGPTLALIDSKTNEQTVLHAIEPALAKIPDDGEIFLWRLSPDLERILLLGGPSESPIRLVASIDSGNIMEFYGPPVDSPGGFSNVGIAWAPNSAIWMEYTTTDVDSVTVYSLDQPNPIRSGSAEAFAFASLNLVALNEREFRAPNYDHETRVGVATWRIEEDGSVHQTEVQLAPFETYTEEEYNPQVDPILLSENSEGQKWLVSDFTPRRSISVSKSFPFLRTQTERGRYEVWETQPDDKAPQLIWKFSDVKPKFELSITTDSQYLSFLDHRKFWTIPIDR